MKFHIISIFPSSFDSYLQESIIARAIKEKKISVKIYNPRDNSKDKHHKVDDRPFGGGPGMVMSAQPILDTVLKIKKVINRRKAVSKIKVIIFSPKKTQLTNMYAEKILKGYTDIIMIAGRYEGIDARVKKALRAEEVTIGDYVLTGGELPAMVLLDVCTRRIDGVLGNTLSLEEERVSCGEMYTRPPEVEFEGKKYKVPKVLFSGNHKDIEEWKKSKSV